MQRATQPTSRSKAAAGGIALAAGVALSLAAVGWPGSAQAGRPEADAAAHAVAPAHAVVARPHVEAVHAAPQADVRRGVDHDAWHGGISAWRGGDRDRDRDRDFHRGGWGWGGAVGLGLAPAIIAEPYGYYDYAPPAASQTWYYCADPAGYYPYVTQCYSGWQPVPAG